MTDLSKCPFCGTEALSVEVCRQHAQWGCGSFKRGEKPWQAESCRINELEALLEKAEAANELLRKEIERLKAETLEILVEKAEAKQLAPACMDCGLPYASFGIDTTLPDDQWLMINRKGGFNGLLCANCMVRRASKLPGIIAARMTLEFAEKKETNPCRMSGRSALCYTIQPPTSPPREPTDARPGTAEKVAVLASRVLAGEELWHPMDRRMD